MLSHSLWKAYTSIYCTRSIFQQFGQLFSIHHETHFVFWVGLSQVLLLLCYDLSEKPMLISIDWSVGPLFLCYLRLWTISCNIFPQLWLPPEYCLGLFHLHHSEHTAYVCQHLVSSLYLCLCYLLPSLVFYMLSLLIYFVLFVANKLCQICHIHIIPSRYYFHIFTSSTMSRFSVRTKLAYFCLSLLSVEICAFYIPANWLHHPALCFSLCARDVFL